MDDKKITSINGGKKPNPVAELVRTLQSDLQLYQQQIRIMATLTKTKYDAIRKEGFNEEHAIELSKKVF